MSTSTKASGLIAPLPPESAAAAASASIPPAAPAAAGGLVGVLTLGKLGNSGEGEGGGERDAGAGVDDEEMEGCGRDLKAEWHQ